MSSVQDWLQQADFARFTKGDSWQKLSAELSVTAGQLRRVYEKWTASAPEWQPEDPMEIEIPVVIHGRPQSLNLD